MNNQKKLKILLATGIYPPDIGGPAGYVQKLEKGLIEKGMDVNILTFGVVDCRRTKSCSLPIIKINRNQNIIKRYFFYFWEAFNLSRQVDIIYTFDLFSTGLPCALVKILRPSKKLIVRIGGDFLWERAFNNGRTNKPLSKYYDEPKNLKEKFFIALQKFVLRRCDKIIFTTQWQQDIYVKYLGVDKSKSEIIENKIADYKARLYEKPSFDKSKKIIFAGRLINLKNLERLIQAVNKIENIKLDIIGEGPEKENLQALINELKLNERVKILPGMKQSKLFEKMKQSYLFVLPSITDISPNIILESIACGLPPIATRETSLFEKYKDQLIFIDPFNIDDIAEKIKYLLDENNYQKYKKNLEKIEMSGKDLIVEHIKIFMT